jgi:serine protease Do
MSLNSTRYARRSPSSRVRVASAPQPISAAQYWLVALLAAIVLLLASQAAMARSAPESFADLADSLLPAVVNVSTTQTVKRDSMSGNEELDDFFNEFMNRQDREQRQRPMTSLGSGFIIDSTGYVVTNNHVIADADKITVLLHDDTELQATLVGRDEKTDLALLKVDAGHPLPSTNWGNSDELRIGDWVMAIGNPFGLGGTVTAGIVSARGRQIGGAYDDYIQTDASINRGNSGGPLFDMNGQVIGINTAIFSQTGGSVGIGFAIPSSLAKNVIAQIRQYGKPKRGWLGVRIQTVNDELAEGLRLPAAKGALVANVTDDGPADKAGIKQGDVVLRFDNKEVTASRSLPRIVAETAINKKVEVVVWRQGKEMSFNVVVGELTEDVEKAALSQPDEEPGTGPTEGKIANLGISVGPISEAAREQYKLEGSVKGVLVTDVDPNSPAADKGLQKGDVIVEVDQKAIGSRDEIERRVKEAKKNGYRVVTLLVYRGGDYQWVAVRIDKS